MKGAQHGRFVTNHKRLSAAIGFIVLIVALIEACSVAAPIRGGIVAKLGGDVGADGYGLGSGWFCEWARLVVFVF
jgi:hypothetical protein